MNRDDVSEEVIYVDEQGNRVNPQGGTPTTSQYSYPPITQNRQGGGEKVSRALERVIENHINQLEDKTLAQDYRKFLYGWSLKYMRLASHYDKHIWAGEMMRRLYVVASELDGSAQSNYREVSRRIK